MRVLRFPPDAAGLVFDLDNTLYTHPEYAAFQEDSQVERLARLRGEPVGAVNSLLEEARARRAGQGLPKTSMANHFVSFGVDMATIVRWREEEIRPGEWLEPDPALDASLGRLAARFRLGLLTNNPRSVGYAALCALGVEKRFEVVVGLDDTGASKPRHEPFLRICSLMGLPPGRCVSIGDREDVDIVPALALGMGGILVEGVADVYALPDAVIS